MTGFGQGSKLSPPVELDWNSIRVVSNVASLVIFAWLHLKKEHLKGRGRGSNSHGQNQKSDTTARTVSSQAQQIYSKSSIVYSYKVHLCASDLTSEARAKARIANVAQVPPENQSPKRLTSLQAATVASGGQWVFHQIPTKD
jgi:hypothetical protein